MVAHRASGLAWWIMATGGGGAGWSPAWAEAPWIAALVAAAAIALAALTAPAQGPHLWMAGVGGLSLLSAVPLCRRVVRMPSRGTITARLDATHRGPGLLARDAADALRGTEVEDLAHVCGARLTVVMLQRQALHAAGADAPPGLEVEARDLQQTLLDLWLADAVPGEAGAEAQDALDRWRARQEVARLGPTRSR